MSSVNPLNNHKIICAISNGTDRIKLRPKHPMSSPEQLKFIAHKLAAAPFNKQGITAISLHDDLAIPVLVSYLSDVAGVIDNQQKVDYTKESFEEMSERLAYFLNMLNYAQAADVQEYMIALSKSKSKSMKQCIFC